MSSGQLVKLILLMMVCLMEKEEGIMRGSLILGRGILIKRRSYMSIRLVMEA